LGKTIPPIEWQHPLARRVEHSVRLPSLPDDFLETLKKLLQEKGFSLYEPVESEQRVTGVALRRWAWLGVVACYVGLIVLIGAFLMTYYASKTERFTLLPFEPQAPVLFEGEFELTEAESMRMSRVAYAPPGAAQSPQMLTWRLYQPSFLNNTLIFPIAIEPILTIEVRDTTGALLGLEPLQEEISQPIEQLNLPLDESNSPRYFAIPAVNLAVQVSPDSKEDENVFNVQVVVHDSGELLLEKRGIQPGQVFGVENYSAVMFLNHSVSVVARRDPALPLYLVSIILILTGLSLTFLRPPALVWLVPEVKGLGGQLYGVMEKFGAEEKMVRFLEELLAVEVLSEKQEAG
jgi:hypothetical protein